MLYISNQTYPKKDHGEIERKKCSAELSTLFFAGVMFFY